MAPELRWFSTPAAPALPRGAAVPRRLPARHSASLRSAAQVVSELYFFVRSATPVTALSYLMALLTHVRPFLAARSFAVIDEAMIDKKCYFRAGRGVTLMIPGQWVGAAREILCRKVYTRFPHFELRPDDVVVDLGANAGVFSTFAAARCRTVVGVEAQHQYLSLIGRNAAANGVAHKVIVEHALVGPTVGALAADPRPSETTKVGAAKQIGMTELFTKHELERVDFLKIDIEGSEFGIFEADDSSWLQKVDRIAMEVHTAYGDVQFLVSTLRSHGLVVNLRTDAGKSATTLGESGYLFAYRMSSPGPNATY